jgi:ABC-2 type transport system ATP-binding protein
VQDVLSGPISFPSARLPAAGLVGTKLPGRPYLEIERLKVVPMIIELNNLTVQFGSQRVLDGIHLNFAGGSLGLLGPNGAGKSTLLRTLLGFVTPKEGGGRVLGHDIRSQQLLIRGMIGYLPENDCHIPGMNAVSFVAYAGELAGMKSKDAMQRSHEILNYVGLGEARYRTLETYSTGMKQRIKLAQALVHDPALVFLDEPTNGLDPAGRIEMLDLIRDISRSKGIHVVLSSHLLPDVEWVCEDAFVIDKGKRLAAGRIADLKKSGGVAFECRIKGDRQVFVKELRALGCHFDERESDHGDGLRVFMPDGLGPRALLEVACRNKIQIRHLLPLRQSLEDVFLKAVGGGDARL